MKPSRWLSLALILALVLPLGVPIAESAQKSVRTGNQISTTPGSADTLAAGGAKINDHGHEFDEAYLTNKTGGTVNDTEVYAVDAANDAAFVAGDTVSSLAKFVVVVDTTIANDAAGKTARSGLVFAKAQGAIARGQYVRKSATAKAVEDAGVAMGATTGTPSGAIGIAVAAASAGVCKILLFAATASGSWTTILKTANQIVNNSSVLVNDTHLKITVGANDKLLVKIHLEYDGDGAADFKAGFTGPAGSTFQWAYPNNVFVNSTLTVVQGAVRILADTSTSGATGIGATTHNFVDIIGTFVNGATPGTFQFQWAQSAATGSDTTLYGPGSWLEVMRF